jgi:hypothetical protein
LSWTITQNQASLANNQNITRKPGKQVVATLPKWKGAFRNDMI